MPARKPSGVGCSCIEGKVVDEVDDVLVVDKWDRLVSIWPPELAPGAVPPGVPFRVREYG